MTETKEISDDILPVMADAELSCVRDALSIIDGVLRNIGNTSICSSAEMTDSLLDLRNLLSPLLR